MNAFVLIAYFAVILLLIWVLFVLPQRRRARQTEQMLATLKAGDQVVTAGGIFGTVRGFEDGSVQLEVSPGVELKVATRAVVKIVNRGEAEPGEEQPAAGGERGEAEAEADAKDE